MDWGFIFERTFSTMLGVEVMVFAMAAVGLNIQFGYAGLLNFGQVGFMMVGAYGAAITVDRGGPLWLGVIVGVLAAVVLGLVLGIPTLRLRADYLAIVTIATAEILRLTARARSVEPLTNGVFGIQRFAGDFYDANPISSGVYGFGRLSFSDRQLWVILVGWVMVVLMSLLVAGLAHSPWGRVLKAIREDEDAARALGKDVVRFKLQSLVLGGVIGSFAGMLLAFDQQSVNPDAYTANITFFAFLIMILGGAGTSLGPVIGAVTFWFTLSFVDSFLRDGIANDLFFSRWIDTTDLGAIRFALVGLALLLLMAFRPQGILGDRDEVRLVDR